MSDNVAKAKLCISCGQSHQVFKYLNKESLIRGSFHLGETKKETARKKVILTPCLSIRAFVD